jgi:hypothetical protein
LLFAQPEGHALAPAGDTPLILPLGVDLALGRGLQVDLLSSGKEGHHVYDDR